MFNNMSQDDLELKLKKANARYSGYKGLNLDNLDRRQLIVLRELSQIITKMPEYLNLYSELKNLSPMTLKEIKEKTKDFYLEYFKLHDVDYIKSEEMDKISVNLSRMPNGTPSKKIFGLINSKTVKRNPFDLPISLADGYSNEGRVKNSIPIIDGMIDAPERRMYFSGIILGKELTSLSSATLAHEIAHIEQESNIGYAENYLNKEIISIFLEKVYAYLADKSGNLLNLSDRLRINDMFKCYKDTRNISSSESDLIEYYAYIQSTIIADNLFNMFLTSSNRDKFFYDIQEVFDGKITVEDMIGKRNINISNSIESFTPSKKL